MSAVNDERIFSPNQHFDAALGHEKLRFAARADAEFELAAQRVRGEGRSLDRPLAQLSAFSGDHAERAKHLALVQLHVDHVAVGQIAAEPIQRNAAVRGYHGFRTIIEPGDQRGAVVVGAQGFACIKR